jgi:hypothetical protein
MRSNGLVGALGDGLPGLGVLHLNLAAALAQGLGRFERRSFVSRLLLGMPSTMIW